MTSDSTNIADVLLPLALEGPYSYRIPAGLDVGLGTYVNVPLGPRTLVGVVWALKAQAPQGTRLRDVISRYDMPAMSDTHRKFVDWLADYYVEPKGNVLRMVLRCPGAFEEARGQVAYRASGQAAGRMTAQRQRVLAVASEGFAMRGSELAQAAGVGTSVVKALAKDGALETVSLPALKAFQAPDLNAGSLTLSKLQRQAAELLRATVTSRSSKVILFDGVTGSGKTEVYFEAMAAALAGGHQVLLLLPEIALTAGFISRVETRFALQQVRQGLWWVPVLPFSCHGKSWVSSWSMKNTIMPTSRMKVCPTTPATWRYFMGPSASFRSSCHRPPHRLNHW